MLILTRSIGETLVIGGEIEITFLRVRGKKIRLGIQAPTKYKISRNTNQENDNYNIKETENRIVKIEEDL